MTGSKRLQDLAELVKARQVIEQKETEKVMLTLTVDPLLRSTLQGYYGRNLSRMFEEAMIERLERDGHLKTKKT